MSKTETNTFVNRSPVVAVLGHVDHGKSSLLDYIRKSNIVDGESGGITQHISAYEVKVSPASESSWSTTGGTSRSITFLDTPGHAAFQNMRERGVEIADIAILIVSAEDGVKSQTIEAWKTIDKKKVPYIVAINKIDKPNADIEKTKNNLLEHGIYLEGLGGDIPYVCISAKVGTGIAELLETIILTADIQDFKTNINSDATGIVLESFIDSKRGISATLIIKDGTLPSSGSVLTGTSLSPIRIVEDFMGKTINNPIAGQAIKVTGFDSIPKTGAIFISSKDKKYLESIQHEEKQTESKNILDPKLYRNAKVVIPVIIRADAQGTLEAIASELKKNETNDVKIKIINQAVGNITEGDIMQASGDQDTIIVGFKVKMEQKAKEQSERFRFNPQIFDIIYKLSEWFTDEVQNRLPYEDIEKVIGQMKVLKNFSNNGDKYVIGARVTEGLVKDESLVHIIRRDFDIGRAKVIELQQMKMKAKEVLEGNECGVMIESKIEIIPGDILKVVLIEKKKLI